MEYLLFVVLVFVGLAVVFALIKVAPVVLGVLVLLGIGALVLSLIMSYRRHLVATAMSGETSADRRAALATVSSQRDLTVLAREAPDPSIRSGAAMRLASDALLEQIAASDSNEDVRRTAERLLSSADEVEARRRRRVVARWVRRVKVAVALVAMAGLWVGATTWWRGRWPERIPWVEIEDRGLSLPQLDSMHAEVRALCDRVATPTGNVPLRQGSLQPGSVVAMEALTAEVRGLEEYGWRALDDLPFVMAPQRPVDVSSVVCVRHDWMAVGSYLREGTSLEQTRMKHRSVITAVRERCDVAVVAWPGGRLLGKTHFFGEMPPPKITESESSMGEAVSFATVNEWLAPAVATAATAEALYVPEGIVDACASPNGPVALLTQSAVVIWDPAGMSVKRLDLNNTQVTAVACGGTSTVAMGGQSGVYVLDARDLSSGFHGSPANGGLPGDLAVSGDGTAIAAVYTYRGQVCVWDSPSLGSEFCVEPVGAVEGGANPGCVAFSPDSRRHFASIMDRSVFLHDGDGAPRRLRARSARDLCYSPSGDRLAMVMEMAPRPKVGSQIVVVVWDVANRQPVVGFRTDEPPRRVAWGHRHMAIAAGNTVICVDPTTSEPTRVLRGHSGAVGGVAMLDEQSRVLSWDEHFARIWTCGVQQDQSFREE